MDDLELRNLAELSKLHLSEADAEVLRPRLVALLAWFEELAAVDTEGVPPTVRPHCASLESLRLREDVAENALGQDAALANAPARRAGQFAVPRVIEG